MTTAQVDAGTVDYTEGIVPPVGLVAVCPSCGEAHPELQRTLKEYNKLFARLQDADADREKRRQRDPLKDTVQEIFERWSWVTKHPRAKFSPDRFDLIRARMREGYSKNELLLAVEGIGAFPYVVNAQRKASGKPDQRHDKLSIAMRNGEKVEEFANLGARWRREQGMPALELETT